MPESFSTLVSEIVSSLGLLNIGAIVVAIAIIVYLVLGKNNQNKARNIAIVVGIAGFVYVLIIMWVFWAISM